MEPGTGILAFGKVGWLHLERVPNWLRWVLCLPAAVVAPFIWTVISRLFMPYYLEQGLLYEMFESAMVGLVFVLAGAWVAPVRRITSFVLGAVVLFFAGFSLALVLVNPYAGSVAPWRTVVSLVCMIGGAGYATWFFGNAQEEDLRQ